MDDRIEEKRTEIVSKMKALRRRLESDDDSELLVWVIPNRLACAHRPLRHHPLYGGAGHVIPATAKQLIIDWVEQIRLEGIASIISLMHDRDLAHYGDIDFQGNDLFGFLQQEEFRVCRLPWKDPAYSRSNAAATKKKLISVQNEALRL